MLTWINKQKSSEGMGHNSGSVVGTPVAEIGKSAGTEGGALACEALLPFQSEFIGNAIRPEIDTAALSLPRGNGKSALAGHLLSRVLTPDDVLFCPGTESVLCAASIEQARIVFRFARQALEPIGGYRFLDSSTRIGITHKATNTRLRVIGSKGKTAMGLVGCPWAICDEPGAWEVNGGQLLHDAIETAKGKPGSPLKVVYIGTLAPATGGWWHDLIADGSHGSVYVQALQGNPKKWDHESEIERVNPLTAIDAKFKAKLIEERDDARRDSRLKARFLSYRLNLPSVDESEVLLTVDDWQRVCQRQVPDRQGVPMFAYDLGSGRAWSAAVAIWMNGRVEALALAPGIPSIQDQETRDRVPKGTYARLVQEGSLSVSEGLRVQPPAQLHKRALEAWGSPDGILCDRFKYNELQDCVGNVPLIPRVWQWSTAAEDIRALRKLAKDGPLTIEHRSRNLLTASLTAAMVENDRSGNYRLTKRDPANNTGRDDVAVALTLAAGALQRAGTQSNGTVYHGMAA